MAKFDYARSQATALRLIERFGGPVILRQLVKSGPAHNPVVTPQDATVNAAVLSYDAREVDGSRVLVTDKRVLMAGGGPVPALDSKVVIEGVPHSIIPPIQTLKPAGVVVLYELQVRK